MTKKHSVLILSLITVLLAVALVVGATYALFSDSIKVTNHLEAGKLEVTLTRYSLTWSKLDANGTLSAGSDEVEKPFTDGSTDNVFGIEDEDLVVPGSNYTAWMRLDNKGDVAVGYWVEIKLTVNGAEQAADKALAEQLKLTVTPNGKAAEEKYLSEGLTLGSDSVPIAKVNAGSNTSFSVKIDFVHDDDNNDAQEGYVTFDLIVHAIQVTA